MKIQQQVKEYIKELSFPELSKREENKKIIELVKDKFNIVISGDDLYEIKTRTRKLREAIDELNEKVGDEKLYEVVNNHYVFIKDDLLYKIPVEEIDAMFYDFSKHGGNLTGEAMLQKYSLKPEVFHMIKNRLRLYKDSNVISPHTAENTPEEQLDDIITEASARHIDTIKSRMVRTHEKLYAQESRRAIGILANQEAFLSNVHRFIENYKPRHIKYTPSIQNTNFPPLTIAMSDFHFGKKGTKEIEHRMSYILEYIKSQPNTDINIFSLGDLAESLVEGGMHPGQEAAMELNGIDLIMYIVDIFVSFLEELYKDGKNVNFVGIGGNHDRLGKTHSDDMARTGALVIYELIKRSVSNTNIQMSILRDKTSSIAFGNTNYIIAHGDDGFSSRRMEDILWKNGDNSKYNVILHGDKHNVTVGETKLASMVGLPALAGRGEYDSRLDLHSTPGFVMIEENTFGSVDIFIKRLK